MRRLFLYAFLLLSTQLHAQFQPEYIFSSLSARNGLISEVVTGVQQDDKGFMWISTLNGLQRFDARRFVTFRHIPGDTLSIPNDNIFQSLIDHNNYLWLHCDQTRIGYFNLVTQVFHETPIIGVAPNLLKKGDSRLQIDADGNILLLFSGQGIFVYNRQLNAFTLSDAPLKVPKGWNPRKFFHDKANNNYWIATDSGLVKYNSTRKTLSFRNHNPEKDLVIEAMADLTNVNIPYLDRTGRFWLMSWPSNTGRAIYSVDKGSTVRKNWDPEISTMLKFMYFELVDITELKDGSLWIMGLNLFARLNKSTDKFETLPSNLPGQFSIRYDIVGLLFEDREQNTWVTTNNGLFRMNPSAQFFKTVHNRRAGRDTIFTPEVTDILQTKQGEILISTWGNGIFSFDAQLNPIKLDFIKAIENKEVFTWCMVQRANGEIWRGQQDGYIYITRPGDLKTEIIQPQEIGKSTVRQMEVDKSGNIWFGTQSGKLVKWTAATNSFMLVQNFRTVIQRLFADKKGNIWVCTQQSGVFQINSGNGRVLTNYNSDGPSQKRLLHDYSTDIIQYNDSLYIIAAGGLNMLDITKQEISHLASPSELPSNTISNLAVDRWGYVWVTTLSGLVSLDMSSKVVTNYNAGDGVLNNTFSAGSSGTLSDGRIIFGAPHDWTIFDPDIIARNGNKPAADVTITRISQMNKWLNMDSVSKLPMLTLKYDQNSVTFEFSTLTYQSSYGVFYMLEGLDKDWQLSRFTHLAVYNYLPPGDYTFKALCKNSQGEPSKVIATIKIKVKSPFWQTWWFLGLLIFALIFILYQLDKVRTHRIRATESIRTRIATSLTEDMTNSLSNINISSELAKTKVDTDAQRTREYISQISDTSNRMVQAMYDMVWSINPNNDTMADTIDRMKNFAGEIESLYNVNVDFDTDKHVESLKLDMEHRYELLAVFKEAITNAGKHSGGKFVKISLRHKKSRLMMMIVDDGKGFTMDNATMLARGISDMRRRATAINASFYIESEINTGTIVKLEVPV